MNKLIQNKTLISVVIPTYNGEKYLAETISSIKKQTFENFEVLFIDDISTDSTLEVIKENIKDDSRFKIFERKEKAGTSVKNQQFALNLCNGDYYFYMSQDDIIDSDFFQKSIEKLEKTNADAVIPNLIYYFKNKNIKECSGIYPPKGDYNTVINNKDAFKLCLNWQTHSCCLRRMDLMKNLGFDTSIISGDEVLSRIYLYYCKKITFVDTNFYYRLDNENALTKILKPNFLEYIIGHLRLANFMLERDFDIQTITKWIEDTLALLKTYRNRFEKEYHSFDKVQRAEIQYNFKRVRTEFFNTIIKLKKFKYIFKIYRYTRLRKAFI